jgi:hypothetical protein
MADISQFKANMSSGGARSNQFRCIITFPGVANAGTAGAASQFLCKAASIPSFDVAQVEVMYRGRPVNFAGERTFQPWTISVYNDTDFILRSAFENWINGMAESNTTSGIVTPSSYQSDLEVHQLDRNDVELRKYRFADAFPVSVGAINLSWDQNNAIQEYDVTFAYNYYTTV